jgi:hypothetical protein
VAKKKSAPRSGSRVRSTKRAQRPSRPRPLSPDAASRIVKRAAEAQRIVISLTDEQFEQLVRNFKPEGDTTFNPKRPFLIDFQCGTGSRSRLPVASCAFWSDTCCA